MEFELNHTHFEMAKSFDFGDMTPPTSPTIKQEPCEEALSHVHSLMLPSSCEEVPDHDDLFSTLDFHPVALDDLTPPTSPLLAASACPSPVSGVLCGSDLASLMCDLGQDENAASPVPSTSAASTLDECFSDCLSAQPSPSCADFDVPSGGLNLEEAMFDEFDPVIAQAASAAAAFSTHNNSNINGKRRADFADFLGMTASKPLSAKALDLSLESKRRKLSPDVKDKRASHNVSERQRRQEMKKCFDRLRVCVPSLEDNPRVHTGEILKCAYDIILALREEEETMLVSLAHLRAENQRLQASVMASSE